MNRTGRSTRACRLLRRTIKVALGLLCMTLLLDGRQASRPSSTSEVSDHETFMNLRRIYNHCRSNTEPDAMLTDSRRLSRAVGNLTIGEPVPLFLPEPIQHLISNPPSGLAVDLKAMAAACTLYTGEAARSAGRNRTASEQFRSVIFTHSQAEYPYYVDQARLALAQMENEIRPARELSEQVLQVSAQRPFSSP